MPTMFLSSPTTTSAVNENRRPPFTTLATRLISTTRSWRSWPWGPRPALSGVLSLLAIALNVADSLEAEPALPGAFRQQADLAVIAVAAPVEHAGRNAGVLGALGQQLTGLLGLLLGVELAQIALGPDHRGQRVSAVVVDELGLHPAVGAEHGQAGPLGRAAHLGAHPAAPAHAGLRLGAHTHARLPTFRGTYSPW